jgi:hypothetical protein
VLSRGLIDVLPDEASLAMGLAHELSHVVLGHRLIDTKFAFADRMMIGDAELLDTIAMRRDPAEEAEADAKVVEMLDRSPYKDKLASAGLFLRLVAERSTLLPELIHPHVGDHVTSTSSGQTELMTRAPELNHRDLAQVPALPIGARLVVDPWDGRLELLRSAAALPGSLREKMPLAITPLTPHLRYPGGTAAAPAAAGAAPARVDTSGPVSTAAEATMRSLRDIERSAPVIVAPQVPALAPVPDLVGPPPTAPTPPGVAPVPDLSPLPGSARVTLDVLPVPSIEPAPDACAVEGTDAACTPKVPE